ncbi:putative cold-shock-like protein [Bacteroides fragilis 638R]|uniref:Putative cold-shock-like protein n=1 Tax=Bacteroides fragilis (strain 638R) TaxID=862962 RepID=E1WVM3_BACF6|nr:putative cold-shock-like protein [Bacteroides fragilis 638R]
MEVAPLMGRIEYFNAAKGYGFVKDTDCGEKYFFHISSAPATIAEGDRVTFEIERGMRGMNAVRISIVTE